MLLLLPLLLLVVNILPPVLFSRLPPSTPRVRLDLHVFATFLFFLFFFEINDCENNNESERGIIFIELINFHELIIRIAINISSL